MRTAYQATSTWGDGPDVLLRADCEGYPTQYFDLTTDQAEKLAGELINAVRVNRELEISIAFQDKRFTHEVRCIRLARVDHRRFPDMPILDARVGMPTEYWVPCIIITEDEGQSTVRTEDGATITVEPQHIRKREQ